MTLLLATLRSLRGEKLGSVPLQYALVAAGTAIVTMMIVQTSANNVAERLNAVTDVLNKVQTELGR